MNNPIDQIYKDKQTSPAQFQFDRRVARVFHDMISRSVPGYVQILNMLPTLVRVITDSLPKAAPARYYDLGCSLGAGMAAISQGLGKNSQHEIIGIDNSQAMLDQAALALKQLDTFSHLLVCQDIQDSKLENAALCLMNFTLQFIPLTQRNSMINKIQHGLLPGGALILSEKIKFHESATNSALTDIHHQYKFDQGYSQLEIAQKREAIENVLIPETLSAHEQRLRNAGFSIVTPWVQNLQFISILAIK